MSASASPRVMIGIPAYNEQAHIAAIVKRARPYGAVVVVDDGSQDLTAHRAQKAGAKVIRFPRNHGKGAAAAALFEEARASRMDFLVLIDGDGEHDPDEIPGVLAPCLNGKADIVVGSRYLSIHNTIPVRQNLRQRLFNTLTSWATGVPCTDSQSGFRAFNRLAIASIQIDETAFSLESEQQFEVRRNKLRLAEVPITCKYDEETSPSAWHHHLVILYRLVCMSYTRRVLGYGEPATIPVPEAPRSAVTGSTVEHR
ncbi:MAG TPA: glycosyltransferase family 2 protein [Thermomicrobiales bacterium]|nr:glycosyltransferase family 2 protein [Thermomicrobiales bacterium]